MDTEEWRPIPDHPGYEASSHGRVRKVTYGLIKLWRSNSGYLRVGLTREDGHRHMPSVHKVVTDTFIGVCPDGYTRNHKDGDKDNNRPENLEFLTIGDNHKHAYKTGLKKPMSGSKHGMAKLTETDVIAIRARRSQGEKMCELATDFGVSSPTIVMICNRKTWRHI